MRITTIEQFRSLPSFEQDKLELSIKAYYKHYLMCFTIYQNCEMRGNGHTDFTTRVTKNQEHISLDVINIALEGIASKFNSMDNTFTITTEDIVIVSITETNFTPEMFFTMVKDPYLEF